jgi:TolA-binding protein
LQPHTLYASFATSARKLMLRMRFTSGLTLGLMLGVPAGALIALLLVPSPPAERDAATSLQVQELTRRLEAAKEDRQRMERQLEQFQALAERMTASFNSLEVRFKALEEEQRIREVRSEQAPVQRPAAPAPQAGPGSAADQPAASGAQPPIETDAPQPAPEE